MQFGTDNASLSLYYSFVTLTTLGYGDVSPAVPLSRMLAALEALTGQLYIAVLVARLVALQILHSEKHE
jgi:voltage-gated potassium channel Kch